MSYKSTLALTTKMNEIFIRKDELSELLEILESSKCETLDEAMYLIYEIQESYYSQAVELSLQIAICDDFNRK